MQLQKVVEELTLSYGVGAVKSEFKEEEFKLPNPIIDQLKQIGLLSPGEMIIVVHGQNYYVQGSTNAVALLKV